MRTLEYAPRAELDLIDIHAYSIVRWGETRADRYIDDLRAALEWLADNPFAARLRTEITPPVRVWPVESHVALYEVDEARINILSVVHAARNWRVILQE